MQSQALDLKQDKKREKGFEGLFTRRKIIKTKEGEKRQETVYSLYNTPFRGFLINKLLLRNNASTNCKNPCKILGADNLLLSRNK